MHLCPAQALPCYSGRFSWEERGTTLVGTTTGHSFHEAKEVASGGRSSVRVGKSSGRGGGAKHHHQLGYMQPTRSTLTAANFRGRKGRKKRKDKKEKEKSLATGRSVGAPAPGSSSAGPAASRSERKSEFRALNKKKGGLNILLNGCVRRRGNWQQ